MKSSKQLGGLVVILALLVAGDALFAWTPPGQLPPNGNVSAPVNVSEEPQSKPGLLGVTDLIVGGTGAINRSDVPVNMNLAIGGSVAARAYCDENGSNCFSPASSTLVTNSGSGINPLDTSIVDRTSEDSVEENILEAQGCTKKNNEDYGANTWMACPLNTYMAAITDDNAGAYDALCCPFTRPSSAQLTQCSLKVDYKINNEVGSRTMTTFGSPGAAFPLIMTYSHDEYNEHSPNITGLSYLTQVESNGWGGSLFDKSERGMILFANPGVYADNKSIIDGWNPYGHIVVAMMSLTSGNTASIVNESHNDISAGTITATATVIGCSSL